MFLKMPVKPKLSKKEFFLFKKNQNSQHSAATSLKSGFSEFLEPQHFAFSFIICLLRATSDCLADHNSPCGFTSIKDRHITVDVFVCSFFYSGGY